MLAKLAHRTFGFRAPLARRSHLLLFCLGLSFLLLVWFAIEALNLLPQEFFPGPAGVVRAAFVMFTQQSFFIDVGWSVGRVLLAFLGAAAIAVPTGLAMSSFRVVGSFTEPIVDFIRYVPVPSLLPIFVLWTGIGETTKFTVLFVGTFFQLVLLVRDDADHVPRAYFDLARTLGASTAELVRDVLVPYLLPHTYDRLRVTLGWCWTYLVIAELIATDRGLGRVIKEAQRFNAADQLFVCFIVLGLIGLGTDYLLDHGHRKLFPYSVKSRIEAHN